MSSVHAGILNYFRHSKDRLKANSECLSVVGQPGTTGCLREDILRDFLLPLLPVNYQLTKSIILDSKGVQSSEFDIVLSNLNWPPSIFANDNVSPIFVENVVAVIEVKSYIDKSAVEDFDNKLSKLALLTRKFYHNDGIKSFITLSKMIERVAAKLAGQLGDERGSQFLDDLNIPVEIKALESGNKLMPAPMIRSVLFGYKGMSESTLHGHLAAMNHKPDLVVALDVGAFAHIRGLDGYMNITIEETHRDLELAVLALNIAEWIDWSNSDRFFLKAKFSDYL